MAGPLSQKRSGLSDLSSSINIRRHEAVGRAVVDERTELERTEVEDERHADILHLRRYRRVGLDQEGALLFVRFYWSVMDNEENAFRHQHQRVLRKLLVKELIPFIYNMTEFPFESLWPIAADGWCGDKCLFSSCQVNLFLQGLTGLKVQLLDELSSILASCLVSVRVAFGVAVNPCLLGVKNEIRRVGCLVLKREGVT